MDFAKKISRRKKSGYYKDDPLAILEKNGYELHATDKITQFRVWHAKQNLLGVVWDLGTICRKARELQAQASRYKSKKVKSRKAKPRVR